MNIWQYRPADGEAALSAFLDGLEPQLREKLLLQLVRLSTEPGLREPHIKHFSLEKYRRLYELREKNKILVRIIFTIWNGDILLLTAFVKRQPRDTAKALERAGKALGEVQAHPERAVPFDLMREVRKHSSCRVEDTKGISKSKK